MTECPCGFTCGTPGALGRHQLSCPEAGQLSARSRQGRRCTIEAEATSAGPEAELRALRAQLHEQERKLRCAEADHEKCLAAYTRFVQDVVASSSAPTLDKYADLRTKEVLGSGHFGYVFTCRARPGAFASEEEGGAASGPERVVVKVQTARQADSVVREWHHGSARSKHPHMVEHLKVLLHLDTNEELKRFLEDAFASGALKGKPRKMPDRWLCILEEYMDGGTAQYLMDKKLLEAEGVAAILRQVANAVSCLHRSRETHNDIKPENVLLKVDSKCGGRVKLIAKLADMGSAEYSMDRTRDLDLLAYTVWCLLLGAAFKKCPGSKGDREAALCELREAATSWPDRQLRQSLPDAVEQLWQGSCDLSELEEAPWLRGRELTVPERLPAGTDLRGAAQKSILSMEKRRSTLMTKIRCVTTLTPRGGKSLGTLQETPSKSEASRTGSVTSDEFSSSSDEGAQEEAATESGGLVPRPPKRASISGSSRPRRRSSAERDAGSPPTARRSSSAGVGFRGTRRGVAARQGPQSEERPKPPSAASTPAAEQPGGGGCADDDSDAEGNLVELRPISGRGGSARRASVESSTKVDNLMRRFPSRSREEVMEALREACGHAGHAADALRKADD